MTTGIATASLSLTYMAFPRHLVYFVAGAIAYRLIFCANQIKAKFPRIKYFEIPFLLMLLLGYKLLHETNFGILFEAIAFILLLLAATIGFSKVINNAFTRFLGKVSYGLYLMNPLVIILLERFGFYAVIRNNIHGNTKSFILSCFISFAIILLLSTFTYYAIEQPAIKFGQAVITKLKNNQVNIT